MIIKQLISRSEKTPEEHIKTVGEEEKRGEKWPENWATWSTLLSGISNNLTKRLGTPPTRRGSVAGVTPARGSVGASLSDFDAGISGGGGEGGDDSSTIVDVDAGVGDASLEKPAAYSTAAFDAMRMLEAARRARREHADPAQDAARTLKLLDAELARTAEAPGL